MKNYFAYEVTTTQKCDMACTYCFEGEELQNTTKQTSTEDIIRSVHDMLVHKEFIKQYQGVKLDFWGGEPTQNTKMIIELMNEFKEYPVDFFFYTNGFNRHNIEKIITNFKFNKFNDDRFSFQISYDGISHDAERIDHNGEGTADKIMDNIRYLTSKYPEIQISIKSTLPIDQLVHLDKHYEHFKSIIEEMPFLGWSPTLEYTNKYIITDEQLELINKQFLLIAKKEIKYFQENNRFVWSWFGTKGRAVCSAGINIANVDINGNLSVCHGALYSPNKEDFTYGNVQDSSVPDLVLASKKKHEALYSIPDQCQGCSATVCYQCPIVNYDNSKNDEYKDKYHDPKSDLCGVYKAFGKIDRTVQKYLNKGNLWQSMI